MGEGNSLQDRSGTSAIVANISYFVSERLFLFGVRNIYWGQTAGATHLCSPAFSQNGIGRFVPPRAISVNRTGSWHIGQGNL